MRNPSSSIYLPMLALVLLSLLSIPFLYASFFCYPAADDFVWGWLVNHKEWNVFSFLHHLYFHTNSRFSSDWWMYVAPLNHRSLIGYQWSAVFLFVGAVSLFALFFRYTISKHWFWALVLGIALQHLSLCLYPNLAEAAYWYNGYVNYTLGTLATLVFFLFWIRFLEQRISMIWVLICYPITVSYSEFHLIVVDGIIGITLLYSIVSKQKIVLPIWLAVVFMVLFSLFLVIAPGNFSRAAQFTNGRDYATIFYMSFTNSLRFLFRWLVNFPLIILSLAMLTFWKDIKLNIELPKLPNWLIALTLLLLLFAAVFVPTFIAGIIGQHRTPNAATPLFFIVYFYFLYCNAETISSSLGSIIAPLKRWKSLWILGFFLSLLFTKNTKQLCLELKNGVIQNVYLQQFSRQEDIKNSEHKNLEDLKPLTRSSVIINYDIRPGKDYFVNHAEALYYKKVGILSK